MQKISIYAINGGLWDDFITIYWKMLHDIVVAMGRANVIILYFLGFFSKIVDKLDNEERQ
jgi:hypothetical protein